jgi:broad specificity phosphatase PhoE
MEIFARVSTSLCAPASRHPTSKRSFSRERHQKQRQRARTHATASTSEAKKTSRTNEKTVILVRHGKTEMNEYLASNHWADEKFKDPLLYDTKLSKAGVAGAQLAQVYVEKLEPKPELIVASPLSRAIMTAKYVFEHDRSTPRAVCAHARERVFHASDHGKTKRELEQLHADFDFSHIESYDEPWWYVGAEGEKKTFGEVSLEPVDVFEQRMDDLIDWINDRDEEVIALVAHWGVCFSLTGDQFENCEARVCKPRTLRPKTGDFRKVELALEDSAQGKVLRAFVFLMNEITGSVPLSVGLAVGVSLGVASAIASKF